MSKLCIIDPACQVPGLKFLFPGADYYAHEPSSFFHFNHFSNEEHYSHYNFYYRTDWETITEKNYNELLLVAPLKDFSKGLTQSVTDHLKNMRNLITNIIERCNFKTVALFDVYDYDYDPSEINTFWKVDYYFKRNYQRTKIYKENVFPFPYIMFVRPCILNMCLTKTKSNYTINRAFWCGGLYNHIDHVSCVYRNREKIHREISGLIDTVPTTSYEKYLSIMRSYKIGVDLLGVGDPNKRTIELLTNGVLTMSMCKDLEWGFEDGDAFHSDTFFSTADEFKEKLARLLTDDDHYLTCLQQQYYIVDKYFNKEWLRNYIVKHAGLA